MALPSNEFSSRYLREQKKDEDAAKTAVENASEIKQTEDERQLKDRQNFVEILKFLYEFQKANPDEFNTILQGYSKVIQDLFNEKENENLIILNKRFSPQALLIFKGSIKNKQNLLKNLCNQLRLIILKEKTYILFKALCDKDTKSFLDNYKQIKTSLNDKDFNNAIEDCISNFKSHLYWMDQQKSIKESEIEPYTKVLQMLADNFGFETISATKECIDYATVPQQKIIGVPKYLLERVSASAAQSSHSPAKP